MWWASVHVLHLAEKRKEAQITNLHPLLARLVVQQPYAGDDRGAPVGVGGGNHLGRCEGVEDLTRGPRVPL